MAQNDDSEEFALRESADPSCETAPVLPVPDVAPVPPEVPCDDPIDPGTEVFLPPTATPSTPEIGRRLPAAILLRSHAYTVACPDGTAPPAGGTYTVPYGEFPLSVRYEDMTTGDGDLIFSQNSVYGLYYVAAALQGLVTELLGSELPVDPVDRDAYLAANLPGKREEFCSTTGLSMETSTAFWDSLLLMQQSLDELAYDYAVRQLICGFYSREMWLVCNDTEASGYTVSYVSPVGMPAYMLVAGWVHIPAGAAFSVDSVEAADQIAISAALTTLTCAFQNQSVTVNCTVFGGEFTTGKTLAWPTATSSPVLLSSLHGQQFLTVSEVMAKGTSAILRQLIYTVTIAANTPGITGATQAEANAKATAIAISQLDCFVPSRELTVSCTDADVNSHAHTQSLTDGVSAVLNEIATGYKDLTTLRNTLRPDNYVFKKSGSVYLKEFDTRETVRLIVPAGAFSGLTIAEADTAAAAFAKAGNATLMDCAWRNRSMTYACDDKFSDPEDNVQRDAHHISEDFSGVTPGHPANTSAYPGPLNFSFKVGQVYTLNSLASATTTGSIELLATPGKSLPYSVTTARGDFESTQSQDEVDSIAAAHTLAQLGCVYCNPRVDPKCVSVGSDTPLPLSQDAVFGRSYDATLGVPGITYTYDTFLNRWVFAAEPSGNLPVTTDAVTFVCSGNPSEVVYLTDTNGLTPARTQSSVDQCRYTNDQIVAACCPGVDITYSVRAAEDCTGLADESAAKIVTIPAGSVFATGSKEEANNIALSLARAQLDCYFLNDEVYAACPHRCPYGAEGTAFTIEGFTGLHGAENVMGNPSTHIAAGVYRSYISKENANEMANIAAESQLACTWTNGEQVVTCPLPPSPPIIGNIWHSSAVTSVTIPAESVYSPESTCAADEIALRMAISQLFCAYTNPKVCHECQVIDTIDPTILAADNSGWTHTEVCNSVKNEIEQPYEPPCIDEGTVISMISSYDAWLIAGKMVPYVPCVFGNYDMTVECDPTRGRFHSSAVSSVSIAKESVKSTIGCEATAIAFRVAVSQLVCLWTNDDRTGVPCPDDTTPDVDQPPDGLQTPCEDTQVGIVTPDDPGKPTVITSGGTGVQATVSVTLYPCHIETVPADTIISTIDAADANRQAQMIADAGSICCPAVQVCVPGFDIEIPQIPPPVPNDPQSNEDCPDDKENWELVTAGNVEAGAVVAATKEAANAIAASIAKISTVCKPKLICNDTVTGWKDCQEAGICFAPTIHSEEICVPFMQKSDVQALAQKLADSATMCCPYYNDAQDGEKECTDTETGETIPPCIIGSVAANMVFAFESKEKANEMAKGLADAGTFCCPSDGSGGGACGSDFVLKYVGANPEYDPATDPPELATKEKWTITFCCGVAYVTSTGDTYSSSAPSTDTAPPCTPGSELVIVDCCSSVGGGDA